MIQDRFPWIAHLIAEQLESEEAVGGCSVSFQHAAEALDRSGFVSRPTWESLRAGSHPPPNTVAEPGEWQHGWQEYASSSLEQHFREAVVFAQSSAANQAHLRSHPEPGASAVPCGAPTGPECSHCSPTCFERWSSRDCGCLCRSRTSLCECGARLDQLGRHRGACPRSGRLRSRAVAPERTLARICREAGAIVRQNVMLQDMNITVSALERRIN